MATLEYDFKVIGLNAVNAALKSLEKRLRQHNAAVNRTFGGVGTKSVQDATEKRQKKAFNRLDRRAQKTFGKRMSLLNAEEQARIRSEHKVHKIARKNQKRRAREAQKAARQEANERSRLQKQLARQDARNMRASRGALGRRVGRSVGSVARTGALYGGMAAAAAGGAALRHEMDLDKSVRQLAIATRGAQLQREKAKELSPDEVVMSLTNRASQIRQSSQAAAQRTGISSVEILKGMAKFQELTGRGDLAPGVANIIGDFANVFGANTKDVGATMGFIVDRLRKERKGGQLVYDTDAKLLAGTQRVMQNIGAQGQMKMIEFASLAPVMSKVTSATANVAGGDVESVIADFVALGQLAVSGGARDAFEATTSLMRVSDNIGAMANKRAFKLMNAQLLATGQAPVDPYLDKNKTAIKNPVDVIADIMRATKGNIPLIQQLFSIRGKKVAEPILNMIKSRAGGKTDAQSLIKATEGMRKEFRTITGARYDPAEFERAKKFARGGSKARAVAAWDQIATRTGPKVLKVFDELEPHIDDIADGMVFLAKALATLIKTVSDNPLKSVGALIGGLIAKDIAAVGIGHLLAGTLTKGVGSALLKGGGLAITAAVVTIAADELVAFFKERATAKKDRKDLVTNMVHAQEGMFGKGTPTVVKRPHFTQQVLGGTPITEAGYDADVFRRDSSGNLLKKPAGERNILGFILDAFEAQAGGLNPRMAAPKGEANRKVEKSADGAAIALSRLPGVIEEIGKAVRKVNNVGPNRSDTPKGDN